MDQIVLTSSELAYIVHILSEYYLQELILIENPLSPKAKRLESLSKVIRLLALKMPESYEQA